MNQQYDLAEQDFRLANRLSPKDSLPDAALGVSYMQTGSLPQAIRSLNSEIGKRPRDFRLQYLLGVALVRSGANPGDVTFTQARAALESSVRLNPAFASSHLALAESYIDEGDPEAALAHLLQSKDLGPKVRKFYPQLAIVYRRTGKKNLADSTMEMLAKLNEQERKEDHRYQLRAVK